MDSRSCYALNIKVKKNNKDEWVANLDWRQGEITNEDCTEGTITTSYFVSTLSYAIDLVLEKMNQFGIKEHPMGFALLYSEDGENQEPSAPKDFKEVLKKEADKRGWKSYHNISI